MKPQLVAQMQARLDTLMKGVFEAPPPPEGTQAKLCDGSVANGMWITPLASLPPPSPPSPPTPRRSLPRDKWLAFAHQWQVNVSSRRIIARQDRALLKKECAPSATLPAREVRFFNAGQVVPLGAPPTATSMCGVHEQYFEVVAPVLKGV